MKIPAADSQKIGNGSGREGSPQIARMAEFSPTSPCPWQKYIAALATNPCLRRATNPKVRCKQIHVAEEEEDQRRRGANGKIMPPPHSVVIRSASETD